MLDLSRYLLGVLEILVLGGFATLGASALRGRLLPAFYGAPARLATAIIGLALLIWTAELLGSFGLLEPAPYVAAMALVGLGVWLGVGGRQGPPYPPPVAQALADQGGWLITLVGLAIATAAVVKFGVDVRSKLGTGMTGFDSTWYHAPFAAGFFQSGDMWNLHFIAPQFLAWFYPANAEIFHAAGMLAFDRDVLSPLLNVGWFTGCLVACWCIGRPYRVAPWSLALGAVALSLPVLSDQAGEARNDIVGTFFLLAAVAIPLNALTGGKAGSGAPVRGANGGSFSTIEPTARAGDSGQSRSLRRPRRLERWGPWIVAGLAAGLAAGTKLNFLLPAAALILGFALLAPTGRCLRALAAATLAALAGGGYWYLRNLIHAGNPLPWFDNLGPISLPAPDQALGGREGNSVLGYITDGGVWSEWFLPGLHGGLTILWPLLLGLALAGLLLCLPWSRIRRVGKAGRGEGARGHMGEKAQDAGQKALAVAGLAGLAVIAAWLIAPTSASGPDGMPRGFESGLRYLAPALVLGLAVLPTTFLPRVARWRGSPIAEDSQSESEHMGDTAATGPAGRKRPDDRTRRLRAFGGRDRARGPIVVATLAVLAAIAIGYPIQRHYLKNRYANPTFATPGLNAAFKWATPLTNARIATTSTRQYPLFGTDLSNHVQYIGEPQPHGGFTAPTSCRQWRRLLADGYYRYVVTTRDRLEPGKPLYPATTRWTEGLGAEEILRVPPTAVFRLKGPLDPTSCP
jgi:hypothetical protein